MKMKRIFSIIAILSIVIFQGCLKNSNECLAKTVASEEATMQAYAASHSMTYTRHSTGLYYQIVTQGTGTAVTNTSRVSVIYTGKLLNDNIFDQSTGATAFYPVTGFISGWQIGLPLINKGGTIRLLIPSSLAYGCTDAAGGAIPANSVLYFDVQVVDVQ
jgi:FKBP-type peptidyl-prolyl cis-trans isomerase FkpA